MTLQKSVEKRNIILFLGCFFAYMFSSLTKSNYTASVAYVVSQGMFTKANAGLIASAFYIFYGIGQALGGIVVDKLSPYKVICFGLIGALICNLILCFTYEFKIVIVVWSISGLTQFGIWPGICKIMATDLLPEFRTKGALYISYGLPVSSLLSYIFSATVLEKFGWSAMFTASTVALVFSICIWIYASIIRPTDNVPNAEAPYQNKVENSEKNQLKFIPLLFISGTIFMVLVSFCVSMLSTGAQTWIPTMIMECYTLSSALASMQSIFLIAMQIVGITVLKPVVFKIKDPVVGYGVFAFASMIPLVVLQFIGIIPLFAAVAVLGLYKLVSSVFIAFTTRVSIRMGQFGCSGKYSGLANAFSSFGVVVASATYGPIAEKLGWTAVTASWLITTVFCIAVCIPAFYIWKSFERREKITR